MTKHWDLKTLWLPFKRDTMFPRILPGFSGVPLKPVLKRHAELSHKQQSKTHQCQGSRTTPSKETAGTRGRQPSGRTALKPHGATLADGDFALGIFRFGQARVLGHFDAKRGILGRATELNSQPNS
jgi:hypothetical protein